MVNEKNPRRLERIYAFKIIYAFNFMAEPKTLTDLENIFMNPPDKSKKYGDLNGFAWELVKGVWEKQEELDSVLASLSANWRLERIGKIELSLLRLALFELKYRKDIPPKVALNEAVELSKLFGDEKSRNFVNGILDAAAKANQKEKE